MTPVPWFRLGAFVLVALLSGVVVVNTISNPVSGSTRQYRAVFTNAEGLTPGSDVMIAGVRVGRIEQVALRDGHAQVSFEVSAQQQIPATSVAAVRYADLLGGRFLALTPGQGGPPLEDGATIPVERTRPALDLTALLNGFKPLFEAIEPGEVNELASQLITVFEGERATIADVLAKVVAVTSTVADQEQVIDQVITNLNTVLGTLNDRREEMRGLISGLAELTSAAARNGPQIAETIDSGAALAGSLSHLLDDIGPGLSQDVRSVQEITAGLVGNQEEFQGTLHELPLFLETLNRAGGYGSWVNVYICNLSVSVGGEPVSLGAGPHSEVCR